MMRLVILAVALALSAQAGDTEVFLSLEEAPRAVFPEADRIDRQDVKSTPGLRARMRKLIGGEKPSYWEPFYISFAARKDGQVIGYAVICEEIGKHRPITFIVATNPQGKVRDVAVMIYRESRGREVRYPGFTRQFRGKGLGDPIAHRRDIRNVTGATLSSRSMARGVRKALAFLQLTYIQPKLGKRVRYLMGTLVAITVVDRNRERAVTAMEAAFAEIRRLDWMLSDYRDDSDLARLNRACPGEWVEIPAEMEVLLRHSAELAAASGGRFRVTVGPLVELWKQAEAEGRQPAPEKVRAAARLTDPRLVELGNARARRLAEGVRVDFGAIGKGYAVDRAVALLRAHGIQNALVDAGSSTLYALGDGPAGRGWLVTVERTGEKLRLRDEAVSTSGGGERYFEIAGRRYSHILDPLSGMPAPETGTVTVTAATATEADAWSTANYVAAARGEGAALWTSMFRYGK